MDDGERGQEANGEEKNESVLSPCRERTKNRTLFTAQWVHQVLSVTPLSLYGT
jgi:hypothetical protein